jgi:hypothetical protein
MPLVSQERLLRLALDALEEATAEAHNGPVRRSWALRLALAYLASQQRHGRDAPRWPFDNYWRSLDDRRQQERWAKLNASLNAIHLTVGQKRDMQRVTLFERRAK